MKDNNININRKPLATSDVEQGNNFDALLNRYKVVAKPFYKRKRFYYAMGVAAAIALLFGVFIWQNTRVDYISQRPFIDPPCKSLQIKFVDYVVPAENGGTYQYKTGSTIIVPANAFMDEKGNIIKGKVNLKYREFHDQADIMLSGIPMQYDSAGNRQLVSAGMLEIYAEQNGQSLKVNPNALINVQMTTTDTGRKYNTYYLDTVAKKWNYISKANINSIQDSTKTFFIQEPYTTERADTALRPSDNQMLKVLNAQIKHSQQDLVNNNPIKPMEPMKADSFRERFNVEVDSNQFPEVAVYKNVLFQITPDEKGYNRKLSNIMWSNVVIKADKKEGIYDVTFSRTNESHTFKTMPVFADENYEPAEKRYEQLYADYEKRMNNKIAEKKHLDSLYSDAQQLWSKIHETESNLTQVMNDNQSTIKIMNFGGCNSDCPASFPGGPLITASFSNKGGEIIKPYEVFLIEKDINTVYRIGAASSTKAVFTYDKSCKNALWIVTTDNRIAVVSQSEFEAETQGHRGNFTFNVNMAETQFSDIDKAKEFLYSNSFDKNTN